MWPSVAMLECGNIGKLWESNMGMMPHMPDRPMPVLMGEKTVCYRAMQGDEMTSPAAIDQAASTMTA